MTEKLDPTTGKENKEKPRKRILVVDDTPASLEYAAACLEMFGYEVVTANDGQKILDLLNSGELLSFDAIFTDNDMPGVYGFDALVEIRKNPKFAKLPVI